MKRALLVAGLAAVFAAAPVTAGEFDKQIKARKALMQVRAFHMGILGAMAKGTMAYDAELAQNVADNLLAASSMKETGMWPEGSGNDNPDNKTRAKPEIWSTYPKVAEKGKDMREAATKMAAVAGDGLDAVKANMGALGDGCKGCHKPFQAPKKK